MRTMDSKECGTVGKVVVVPHTKSCIRSSVMRIIPEDLTVVSIDTSGGLMGVLFGDGHAGLYWYRPSKKGADLGLPSDLFDYA